MMTLAKIRLLPYVLGLGAMAAGAPLALAQNPPAVPYCEALKQITNMAMTRERFAPIIGKPREGNFLETKLPLPGWSDCAFYGPNYYTCDAAPLPTAEEAERNLVRTSQGILSCLGNTW